MHSLDKYFGGKKTIIYSNNNITKPDEAYLIMPSSKRTEEVNKACTVNDIVYVPYSVKKQPFAGFN